MARTIGKLTALTVTRAKRRGYLADGGGLYLQIGPNGTKSWVFRFRDEGRLREMGLGPLHTVSLTEARDLATEKRRLRLAKIDPIAARDSAEERAKLEAAQAISFRDCAKAYIAAHEASWKNEKHAAQWPSTLEAYAYPVIGDLSVQRIDTGLVLKVLEPIWNEKTETASRVRGRIETVLDWAKVRGHRQGDNPARWRGHLDKMLPARAKVQKVRHHAALPYSEIGSFIAALRKHEGIGAAALKFAILTAARTGEVIGATWAEIDLNANVWTIPAERMKAGKEHRVPLSKAAVAVLTEMQKAKPDYRPNHFVFRGGRTGEPLSDMALLKTLERMGRDDLTVHGFRSTFRDWAAEQTNFPREVCEHALAHSLPDKVEAAYRRSDLFEKRRKLMDAWARYCASVRPVGSVIPMNRSNNAAALA